MTNKETCCWGILGAASIARKNWQAILHSGNGTLKAVASRSQDRAAEFIADCEKSVPFPAQVQAVEGYETLLADPEIDAVYIPLPTAIRDRWAMAAIEAGKHVLIEKPCSSSADNLRDLIEAAKSRNLQVMDGLMFAHSQRYAAFVEAIHTQRQIGDVRRIASQFSFNGGDDFDGNIRCDSRMEPFGALGDLGWYCIRICLAAAGGMPEKVTGRTLQSFQHPDADRAVPLEFEGSLRFANNVTASIYCSFVTEIQQWTNISGSEGFIAINDFVLPYHAEKPHFEIVKSEFVIETCDFEMHRNGNVVSFDEAPNSGTDSQEAALFRDFNNCVISGKINDAWPNASLQTQRVMDAMLLSANEAQREVVIEG